MQKLMSNRTGGEKCDMQSDRENTYDSSLFSNIEVIQNHEHHEKTYMKNTLSYEVAVKTHFSLILGNCWFHFGTLLAPNSFKNRIKNRYVNDDAFSSLLERLRAPPELKR